jgi:hypothetical protein
MLRQHLPNTNSEIETRPISVFLFQMTPGKMRRFACAVLRSVIVRTLPSSGFPTPSTLYDFIPLGERAARAKVKSRDRANVSSETRSTTRERVLETTSRNRFLG